VKINYDHLAADYARHRRVHPEVLKDLVAAGHIKSSSRVLEAGCGTGNYLLALQESIGCACCGIDPSEGMLEKARNRSGSARFVRGQAERLDFPPDSFDLVFSVDVVHHVRDRQAYFGEARRVLSAGGRFCTVTDSEWIIRRRRPLTAYFPETAAVELARYPPVPDLLALLAEAGFQQIEARQVELPYLLTDAQPYRDKVFSSLHLIPEEAFKKGIAHLERDLAQGPIACVSYYVLLWGTKAGS